MTFAVEGGSSNKQIMNQNQLIPVCDRGGGGVKKFENLVWTSYVYAPLLFLMLLHQPLVPGSETEVVHQLQLGL